MEDDQETCILCPLNGLGDIEATWICCDVCNEWYHIRCIKMALDEFETIDKYHCKRCQDTRGAGPSTYVRKSSRRTGRVNYADLQNGHVNTESRWKVILDSQRYLPDTFERIRGRDATLERLRATGFTAPLIIKKDGQDYSSVDKNELKMRMPPNSFTVDDVRDAVGKETRVELVDVATQSEVPGYDMERWAGYFSSEHKERIYNVISLEISDTKLADQVVRPKIVRELDWIENFWPTEHSGDEFPKVQLYCLMSVAGSYTDFHIDFAGSSVYYHILSGAKTFYFVEPTPSNLKKYTKWSNSADQSSTFFAGEVNGKCYKVDLEQGDTMLLPTGWIHSVYTPKDSIVIGGNFLHSLNIPLQYSIAGIEVATNVPRKFRFPYFDKMNWFVALGYMKRGRDSLAQLSTRELHGIIALTMYLNQKRMDAKTDPRLTKEERHAIRASVPPEASQYPDGGCMGLIQELNKWCFDTLTSRGEAVDDTKRLTTVAQEEPSANQQGNAPPKIKLRLKIKSTSSTTSAHSDDDDRNSASGEQRVPVADPKATSPVTLRAPVKEESPTTTKPNKLTIKLKPASDTGGALKLKLTNSGVSNGSHSPESLDEDDDEDEDEWDDLERAIHGSDDEFDPDGGDDEIKGEEEEIDYMHSSDSEYEEGAATKRSTTGRSRKRSRTSVSSGSSPQSQLTTSTTTYAPKPKKATSLDAGNRVAQLSTVAIANPLAQREQAETVFFGDDETGADPLYNGNEEDETKETTDIGRKRKVPGMGEGHHYSKGANANYNRSILSSYNTPDSKKPKKVVGLTARERLASKLLRR